MEAAGVYHRKKPSGKIKLKKLKSKKPGATRRPVEALAKEVQLQQTIVEESLEGNEEEAAKYYHRGDDNSSRAYNSPSGSQRHFYKQSARVSSREGSPGSGQGSNRGDGPVYGDADDVSILSIRSSVSEVSYSSRALGSSRAVIVRDNSDVPVKELTLKEIIQKIESNVSRGLRRPSYVCQLDNLPSEKLYWNKKYPLLRKYKSKVIHGSSSAPLLGMDDDNTVSSELTNDTRGTIGTRKSMNLQSANENNLNNNVLLPPIQGSQTSSIGSPTRKPMGRSNSPVNHRIIDIQGCLQPVELVLAKATDRIIRRCEVVSKRDEIINSHTANVIKAIENRELRAENYANRLREHALVKAWLSLVQVSLYMKALNPLFRLRAVKVIHEMRVKSAQYILYRAIMTWYRRLLFVKYNRTFMQKIKNKNSLFIMTFKIRILRKVRAVKKILYMLRMMKEQKKISFVVHRFVSSVKRVQALCHSFLACKRARVTMVTKLWDKLEPKFVRAVLNSRKEGGLKRTKSSNGFMKLPSGIDVKDMIEMEKQAKKWSDISNKMESAVAKQRLLGNIGAVTLDLVDKHLLPHDLKEKAVTEILISIRREHLQKRNQEVQAVLAKRSQFSISDASDLLNGRTEEIDKIVKAKFGTGPSITGHRGNAINIPPASPFFLFKKLTKELMFKHIRKAHAENRTFAIDHGGKK